jgi:hypothetical protein
MKSKKTSTFPLLIQPITAGRSGCPVGGGLPLPCAWATAATPLSLCTADGETLPLQTQPLGYWPDGSVRWLLLDTVCPAGSAAAPIPCTLAKAGGHAPNAPRDLPLPALCTTRPPQIGACELHLELTDGDGAACTTRVLAVEVETAGPLRSTVLYRGDFIRPDGSRVFQFRLRVSAFRDGRRFKVEPMILVDSEHGIIREIQKLDIRVQLPGGRSPCTAGIDTGVCASPYLLQVDDQTCADREGGERRAGRISGWVQTGGVALAMTEFWQQWPKSIEQRADGVALGLLPAFASGRFAHMEPWYKHQYLFAENRYRLRIGQSRSWTIWVDVADGDGPSLCEFANHPPLLTAQPEAALGTGAWGGIAAAGHPRMAGYDAWAHTWFNAYAESLETLRDYGAMNWGDWFGERKVNWGNHEYDTVNQLLIQYARTADPAYFQVASAAAHHSAEVDVVHAVNPDLSDYFNANWRHEKFEPRPGMVHEHCVGHVGAFYPIETIRELFIREEVAPGTDRPYLCLDPFNLGHIWTQGLARFYFLTGDPFIRETVAAIGDNVAKLAEDGYAFSNDDPHFGRTAGWSLLALAGAYEIAGRERYLAAMKYIVELALAKQDPVCGGWLYPLYPGHCLCTTRKHVGMAGFITSILINGLSRYYDLTLDARIPGAVERGVTFLNDDTWIAQRQGWRYTSCPASVFAGRMGVTLLALANGVRLSGNAEQRRILKVAWNAAFHDLSATAPKPGQGKSYTMTLYGCAEAASLLARPRRTHID